MKWISVNDELPEMLPELDVSDNVLVYSWVDGQMIANVDKDDRWHEVNLQHISLTCVTHWMPLPADPRGE